MTRGLRLRMPGGPGPAGQLVLTAAWISRALCADLEAFGGVQLVGGNAGDEVIVEARPLKRDAQAPPSRL